MSFPTNLTISNLSTPNKSNCFYPNANSYVDQFLRKLGFCPMPLSTAFYEFCRADTIPATTFVTAGATLPLNPTDVSLAAVVFNRIGDNLELDHFDQLSARDVDQMEQQVYGKKFSILKQLSYEIFEGTTFPGLVYQANPVIGADNGNPNGGFLTLQDLYKAKYSYTSSDSGISAGADCWVSHSKTLREVLGLLNSIGLDAVWCPDETLGVEVPYIAGMPWYVNDQISLTETKGGGFNLTSVYITKLTGPTALRVLYGTDSKRKADPWGLITYHLPLQSNQDKVVCSVFAYYALFIAESIGNVVRLDGINPTQFAL